MQFKGNIFKFWVELKENKKMCVFNEKTGNISETVRVRAKVTIIC